MRVADYLITAFGFSLPSFLDISLGRGGGRDDLISYSPPPLYSHILELEKEPFFLSTRIACQEDVFPSDSSSFHFSRRPKFGFFPSP